MLLLSNLYDYKKKNEILMKKYLIAMSTLPTFCDLLDERHTSVLGQKLFSIRYFGAKY
jgi:hypothetical protein